MSKHPPEATIHITILNDTRKQECDAACGEDWSLAETIALAEERGIPLLASKYTMFETCGRLYRAGLPSCGLFELSLNRWRQSFENK